MLLEPITPRLSPKTSVSSLLKLFLMVTICSNLIETFSYLGSPIGSVVVQNVELDPILVRVSNRNIAN